MIRAVSGRAPNSHNDELSKSWLEVHVAATCKVVEGWKMSRRYEGVDLGLPSEASEDDL